MGDAYRIKPLVWNEYEYTYPDSSGETVTVKLFSAQSIVSYNIHALPNGRCSIEIDVGDESLGSEWTESVEAGKEFCWKWHLGFIERALEHI